MARQRGNPARLVIALSIAAVLAIFLLYTSIAGGGTPLVQPSELAKHSGTVALGGIVVGQPSGDAHTKRGLRFRVRDREGRASVPVVYRGSVPDLFKRGGEIGVRGELRNGVFVAEKDSLMTKCPSKYKAEKSA